MGLRTPRWHLMVWCAYKNGHLLKKKGWELILKNNSLSSKISQGRALELGSVSIDDGDGSVNVTLKWIWVFFKFCRAYSNSLKMSNVGEFPWSWFLGDHIQDLKEKEIFVCRLFTSSIKRENREKL